MFFLICTLGSQAQNNRVIDTQQRLIPKHQLTRDSSSSEEQQSSIDSFQDNNPDEFSDIDDGQFRGIQLNKVVIVKPMKFDNRDERHDYLILRYKVKRVWPYAVLAAKRLNTLEQRLDSLDSKRAKRRYTRQVQRYVNDEFKDQLKKLSKSEGQILVKLMFRQTGETTFDIVKELRTGWRAFRYNITAQMFTISLKEEYDPIKNKEDYLIEHILQRAFLYNQIEEQDSAIDIDYLGIMEKWGNF